MLKYCLLNSLSFTNKRYYEQFETLKYFKTIQNNNESLLEPTVEPTELPYYYAETSYPTMTQVTMPSFNKEQSLNYTCICKNDKSIEYKKFIILIVFTSISSFVCVLLIFFILWRKVSFHRKSKNKHKNNKLFYEKFGVDLDYINEI